MAYQTGSISAANNAQQLLSTLFTFLTGLSTTPWTQDEFDTTNYTASIHRGSVYVHFRWDNTTKEQIGMYQSLGFVSTSTDPHNHTDDSGNGQTSAPVTTQRRIDLTTSGALTTYHFFAGEGSTPYCHVVVEYSSGLFVHFGFGNLVKTNDWTGGEYCYGNFWNEGSTPIDRPYEADHAVGLCHSDQAFCQATVHCESLTDQDGTSKWGVCTNLSSVGNDRAGNPRVRLYGGARGGLWAYALSWMPTSQTNAFKPLFPIEVAYVNAVPTVDEVSILGRQPDIAVVNMKNLSVGQELTIGSDVWKCFPWARKQYTLGGTKESWNAGWAYKKIT